MQVNQTQKIDVLIEEASQLPNSKAKNKMISKLEEARLWSKELPVSPAEEISQDCICPKGAIDAECPVHT